MKTSCSGPSTTVLVSADAVARMLGVHVRTVYDLAARGLLPHYRPTPGSVRFKAEALGKIGKAA